MEDLAAVAVVVAEDRLAWPVEAEVHSARVPFKEAAAVKDPHPHFRAPEGQLCKAAAGRHFKEAAGKHFKVGAGRHFKVEGHLFRADGLVGDHPFKGAADMVTEAVEAITAMGSDVLIMDGITSTDLIWVLV